MGLAWTANDAGRSAAPGRELPARQDADQSTERLAGQPPARSSLAAGPRHRRPTLLARGGQAVADRITALAGAGQAPDPHPGTKLTHSPRRRTMAARRYWT